MREKSDAIMQGETSHKISEIPLIYISRVDAHWFHNISRNEQTNKFHHRRIYCHQVELC